MGIEEWYSGQLLNADRSLGAVQDVIQTMDAFECTRNHFGVSLRRIDVDLRLKGFPLQEIPFQFEYGMARGHFPVREVLPVIAWKLAAADPAGQP